MNNKVVGVATRVRVMAIIISVILLFVGIVFLVLIQVCIVRRAFRGGFNNGNTIERGSLGSTSMSHDDLEKLPCFDFKDTDDQKETSPVDCAVCLENFKVGEKCRLLPLCKHSFHAECVDLWLLKTPICPICRTSTEYALKGGSASASASGEESGHFSTESGIDVMENQTTDSGSLSEIAVELRQGQTTDSGRFSDSGRVETRESQTIRISTHLISEAGVEPISENQTTRFGSSQLNSV